MESTNQHLNKFIVIIFGSMSLFLSFFLIIMCLPTLTSHSSFKSVCSAYLMIHHYLHIVQQNREKTTMAHCNGGNRMSAADTKHEYA